MYVDDLIIIGTPEDIEEVSSYLMSEFEMNDLGKTKFGLSLCLTDFCTKNSYSKIKTH